MMSREKVNEFANCLVACSGGNIRIALNEQDNNTKPDTEAAHFLKWDEKRLGRDLELYAFMIKVTGVGNMVCHLLEEILLPLRGISDVYREGSSYLKKWGLEIWPEREKEWIDCFGKSEKGER